MSPNRKLKLKHKAIHKQERALPMTKNQGNVSLSQSWLLANTLPIQLVAGRNPDRDNKINTNRKEA